MNARAPDDIERNAHLTGLIQLLAPDQRAAAKRQLFDARPKFRKRLLHNIYMDERFVLRPERGARDAAQLLIALQKLGAGALCYVIASEGDCDDTMMPLAEAVGAEFGGHGVILSCIPGRLALFKPAWPERPQIVLKRDGAPTS